MDSIQICGITLVFTAFLLIIRNVKGEIVLPLRLCACVLISGASLSLIMPILDFLRELESDTNGDYLSVMLKSLGIAFVTSASAELCRDTGENSLASKIEIFGKCEILILSIPILKSLIELVKSISF